MPQMSFDKTFVNFQVDIGKNGVMNADFFACFQKRFQSKAHQGIEANQ